MKYSAEQLDTLQAIVTGYNLNAHQTTECVRESKIVALTKELNETCGRSSVTIHNLQDCYDELKAKLEQEVAKSSQLEKDKAELVKWLIEIKAEAGKPEVVYALSKEALAKYKVKK